LVCRYGGEEFCILMPHVDIEGASQAGERFRQLIESCNCSNLALTASFGVASFGRHLREPCELLDQADQALYAAKRTGRNRVVRWDEMPGGLDDRKDTSGQPGSALQRELAVPIPFHAVTALVSALAYRHADTAQHSRRVADLCVATANGLMSQRECYVLEVAALLHDIGKLGVPDAVLLKPGPLDEQEWKVIRSHEAIGADIITAAFTSAELTAIIRNHHCWYAGSPHDPGLPTGKDIPQGARILAIADAFDAMVSDRVYRGGRSREQAFAELRRCAGMQFDPELVDHFINTVLARDDSRRPAMPATSKETALKIGLQMERLASAADAPGVETLRTIASGLNSTACELGIIPIAEAAAHLERVAETGRDRTGLLELTIQLLELCRATQGAYLPNGHANGVRGGAADECDPIREAG
jgi:putative nucleotidyltransferase with HDIG domain